ncbi:hypothetical protein BV20DRAFT_238511 [Pilatotrama ljubarskyi]|nr:hypothetical protein BV20DRAFT_238511 [Pilatotrama ljubarskyi]
MLLQLKRSAILVAFMAMAMSALSLVSALPTPGEDIVCSDPGGDSIGQFPDAASWLDRADMLIRSISLRVSQGSERATLRTVGCDVLWCTWRTRYCSSCTPL